jgi:hypothetical protein
MGHSLQIPDLNPACGGVRNVVKRVWEASYLYRYELLLFVAFNFALVCHNWKTHDNITPFHNQFYCTGK